MQNHKSLMPQEVEVWYLIPALRKEIALFLVKDFGFNQKNVAEIFGVTEAAVSQYMSSKRANEINFSKKDLEKIKKVAKKISHERKNFMKHLYSLCVNFRNSKILCQLHRKKDKKISKDCRICIQR